MWTLFKGLVILFWLTTTVLLVRNVYFPPNHQLHEIPAGVVMKGFLDHGAELNAMQIFHNNEKIGHAVVTPRKVKPSDPASDYILTFSGSLEPNTVPSVQGMVSWSVEIRLKGEADWSGVGGLVRFSQSVLDFHWDRGEKFPHFVLKQNGQWKMDDRTAAPWLAQGMLGPQVASLLQAPAKDKEAAPAAAEEDGLIKVHSQEGILILAGQKRRGYMIDLTFMDTYHMRAMFTEAHELALVELPEGYKLEDSNVYNLEPDIDDGGMKQGK